MSGTSPLSPQQYDAMVSASGPARFKHFIGKAGDEEKLWGLRNETGWVSLADDSGAEGLPIWPHADYAAACADGSWTGCVPSEINVYDFVETWVSDLESRNLFLAVFPTPSMKGIWISPAELKLHLVDELAKYE